MKFGPTLFAIDERLRAIALQSADVPALQAFFEANPAYFEIVNGRPAQPGEAREEFDSRPPEDMAWERIAHIGFVDDARPEAGLIGMAGVIQGLLAPKVGHVGLFIVATDLHGTGTAERLYEALEHWMRANFDADWLRLGVVAGNVRAAAFWRRVGYRFLRERGPVTMGLREHMVQVMMKPLKADGSVEDYLALLPRDRPVEPGKT